MPVSLPGTLPDANSGYMMQHAAIVYIKYDGKNAVVVVKALEIIWHSVASTRLQCGHALHGLSDTAARCFPPVGPL